MSELKYKVGDKVRVNSIDWYNKNKDEYGDIDISHDFTFYADRSKYCGRVFTISEVFDNSYFVKEDNNEYYWSDEMFEGLVEEEAKPNIIEEAKTYWDGIKDAWICPEGYIFKDENGNVINAMKIVLEKKKREYPKTYDECCEVLGIGSYFEPEIRNATTEECHKFTKLIRLKRCRDAYWKLYGEEMGLEKPWEPDFEYDIYYIYYDTHKRIFSKDDCAYGINVNHFLVFPTEEMRDAFYENFKEEIEICKELL